MTEKNAMIKISAKETEITGKNAKPQIIPELREQVASAYRVLTSCEIVIGDNNNLKKVIFVVN